MTEEDFKKAVVFYTEQMGHEKLKATMSSTKAKQVRQWANDGSAPAPVTTDSGVDLYTTPFATVRIVEDNNVAGDLIYLAPDA